MKPAPNQPPVGPAPFVFRRDGLSFVCAWHPGFDRAHPANIGQSHGLCDACAEQLR